MTTEAPVRPFSRFVDEFLVGDAIVETIRRTKLFRGVGTRKTSDFELLVRLAMNYTGSMFTARLTVGAEWILRDLKTGAKQWEEFVRTEGIGEGAGGDAKARVATARAIEKNICEGLTHLSKAGSSAR